MPPDVGILAHLACVWEATARKAGNVHRYCDFEDATYLDFVVSAAAIAPVLKEAHLHTPGRTILDCVRATRQVTRTNTNLGIVLLLTPLAAVPIDEELRPGVDRVLAGLDVDDARLAYKAIRLANPGGLSNAPEQDVAAEPTVSLREAMALAADRDLVAQQYADGFQYVFDDVAPSLAANLQATGCLEGAIIGAQLSLLARRPDSLIARKCGAGVAAEAAHRAQRVLAAGWPDSATGPSELAIFDRWLRGDGHRRNPGTTADLITAGLFVLLRDAAIDLPVSIPWSLEREQPAAGNSDEVPDRTR